MAFGKKEARRRVTIQTTHSTQQQNKNQSQTSNADFINVEDDIRLREEDASQSSQTQNSETPLLEEVTMIEAPKGKNVGGTKRWRCKHCNKTFSSSYTRIHQHFFGPPEGVKAEIGRCHAMLTNRALLQQIRNKVQEAEQAGISSALTKSTINNKLPVAASMSPIEKAFGNVERHDVDMAVVRFLCANGIPFNVLRSPEMQYMTHAMKNAPEDYKPPSADRARTSLLDDYKRDVEKQCIPVSETWTTYGTSIVSDGWSNIKHMPLINVIASNSRGSMFLYADVFSGVKKSKKVIADFLLKAIDEIGPSNVLQVVTDNAANCKAAGKEIEKVHKHIFWSPCVVHTLNLIFKDFAAKFSWMENTYTRGKTIVKYFINHDHAHEIFRNHSGLELLKVTKKRFGSHHILLKRLSECREALATTIVVRAWKEWLYSGDEQTREVGREVAATIADEEFWDEVDNIVAITKPLYYMIKYGDGEGQKMGEVYEKMDSMIGEIGDIMNGNIHQDDYEKMREIMVSRWEKMNVPMHCLGFALNPFFYDSNYLNTPAPGGEPRRPPNRDREVVNGVLTAFDKVGEDQEERRVLRQQLAKFQAKEGMFGTLAARIDAVTMSPISWWSTYGAETPELSEIAIKVLSQPISSSSAERIWSTYSYIHNVKRNRLNSVRADNEKLGLLSFMIEFCNKKLSALQLFRYGKKPVKDVDRMLFVPLTDEEENDVTRAFSNANRRRVLVTHQESNIEITGELLQCLRPGAWLNEEVINLYLVLLKEREQRDPQKFQKCHFFNTFFYKKLIGGRGGYDFKSVRRWTTQRKLGYCLFECDKIFIPIHKEAHWCLAIINKKEEKFQYLDSLKGRDKQVMTVLARYFVDEVNDKRGKVIDVSSWKQEFVEDLPEQQNGYDSGMFMIKYSDFYSKDVGLCFNQEHTPYFRRRTAKEILRLKAD